MLKKKAISLFVFICTLIKASSIWAGGICLYEISSADTRLASAGWAARAEDPSTLFTNPAGMTRLCGPQLEVGLQPIFTHVYFDPDSETTVEGSHGHANKWLPAGSFFYVHPISDKLTVGVGNLGYFGADLDYNHGWAGRYYVQKVMLEGFSLVPTAAYRINSQWSVGAGLNVMYGIFKQRAGINNFLDEMKDGYVIVKGYRFGFGGVFGVLFELTENTRFGVQYLTPVRLSFHDRPKFGNIGPALEDILTLTGIKGSKLNLHVTVPQSIMFSAYHQFCSGWAIMGNVGWQQWSRFEQVSIVLADLDQRDFTFKHKFKDTWHVALGIEAPWSDCLKFSSGIAYDSSAVTIQERTPNFPVASQWRVGTGARWIYSENLTFDFSSELQWQGDFKLDINKGPLAGRVKGLYKDVYAVFTSVNMTYSF